MKLLCNFFLCIVFAQAVLAQKVSVKQISDTHPVSKEKYVFPLVVIPGNKTAADKINKLIQEDILFIDSSGFEKSIFENIWDKDKADRHGSGWLYTDFSYSVYSITDKYLSLSIEFVGGKWLQIQNARYLFDINTGNKITLEKIFNDDGKKWLVSVMGTAIKKRIEKHMIILKDSLQKYSANKNSEMKEWFEDAIGLYDRCKERYPNSDEYLEYSDFYVENNRLIVIDEGCDSGGPQRALDELGTYTFSRKIQEIDKYLSVYGKKLLSHSSPVHKN